MKVLFYIDSMQFGGANRVMSNLVYYFVQKHEVILVNDIIPDTQIGEYGLPDNIHRYFLDEDSHVLDFYRRQIRRIRKLRSIIKIEKPDTVLSFLGPPNIRMLIASIGLRVKKVVSVRNDPFREYGHGIKRLLTNMLFTLADGYVFQTKDAASYFFKGIQKKAIIIFNPVAPRFFNQERVVEKKEILMVCRLQVQKNISLALKAFADISSIYPDYKLVICGDGDLKSDLIYEATALGVCDRVVFLGNVNNVEKKYAEAAIFLLSSDFEGMPNALMEAMAVGVPVVATDCPCGGPKCLINHGVDGYLVDCGDFKAMAHYLDVLLGNDNLRKEFSRRCRDKAKAFNYYDVLVKWESYLL